MSIRKHKRHKTLLQKMVNMKNDISTSTADDFEKLWVEVSGGKPVPDDFTPDDLSLLLGLLAKAGFDRTLLKEVVTENEKPDEKADKVEADVTEKTADDKTDTPKETADGIEEDAKEEGKEASAEVKEAVEEAVEDVLESVEKAIETDVKDAKTASKLLEDVQKVKEIVTKLSTNYDKITERLDALANITKNTVNSVPAPQPGQEQTIDFDKLTPLQRAFAAALYAQ